MLTFTLISLSIALLAAAMAILHVATMPQPQLAPASHFGQIGFDPGNDTLPNAHHTERTLDGDAGKVDLFRLCDVESLLDTLEASNATRTEVEIQANDKFTVRWR